MTSLPQNPRFRNPGAPLDVGGSGTLTAREINSFANEPRNLTLTVSGRGALVPVLYGRRDVPGILATTPVVMSPSGDLLVSYIWCFGEVDAIEQIYINDAIVAAGGTFAITNYLGTPTQAVDPTLQANIAGYNDRMRVPLPGGGFLGVAYSVVRIPAGRITGFPRARAVIRGRKVFDPRTGLTAYSANPALCTGDLITNNAFGLGRSVLNLAACADWCDELLGGVAGAFRARAALYLAEGRQAEQYLDLLCEYAEALYTYEGPDIKMIPNAPVDLGTVPIITGADIIEGTLTPMAESSVDTPTEMEIQYTEIPATATQPWALTTTRVSLAGVDEGEVQRIPTSVTYEGVTSAIEAVNKATARLNRMQNRMTYSWVTVDHGVLHQRGDVVRLQIPEDGIDDIPVRIMKVSMPEPARYAVEAMRYDPSHYPSDIVLPGEDGVVPVGTIAMLVGTVVPDGWQIYSAANGKYVRGAGADGVTVNASGNSPTGPWSGTTSTDGQHNPSPMDIPAPEASPTGSPSYFDPDNTFTRGAHSHTWSVASVQENLLRRENILVKKITSTSLKIPPQVRVFGLPNVSTEATKNTSFSGRLLLPAAANANAGVSTQGTTNLTTGATSDAHTHHGTRTGWEPFAAGPLPQARYHVSGGGNHTHTANVRPTYNPKRRQLCAYESTAEYSPRPGMIYLWDQDLSLLPPDHVVCDGTNGTPDMRGRFVEFAATTPVSPTGDNTVNIAATTSQVGHSHDGGNIPGIVTYGENYAHSATVFHSHSISLTTAYVPKWYGLHFIMFTPTE